MLPYWKKKKKKEPKVIYGQEVKKERKPDLVKRLDKVFSQYIRLRDVMPNGYARCIACGRIKPFAEMDCGHYFSRTHMATRFSEDNCHAECRFCNRMSADHLIGYRENLISKIGMGRYERLTVMSRSSKHWMDFELKEMIEHYKQEVKRLSAEKGIKI